MKNENCNFLKDFYSEVESIDSGFALNLTHLRNNFVLLEYERIANEILHYLKVGDKLLDWGCGVGHMMYLCTKKGKERDSRAWL